MTTHPHPTPPTHPQFRQEHGHMINTIMPTRTPYPVDADNKAIELENVLIVTTGTEIERKCLVAVLL